ncbi:TMP-TENI-domain-containing protein [Coemansia reversa NRRL 1564]|uniref:TMP-TENI-domain-containing protein n=1 Tax=Coemansia reversa (strain ATCC 12441 / NRRL 1564) TaxID=763665 RepID=A0A2G5B578_COERN|nr:TMP-TENI-domain-containing protein [Coemansia reversa NRRL 1564]|eukprot:PIA14168.1 TMP-TENI-domain-containing protein [Coemansia reversa NRRL 1564]
MAASEPKLDLTLYLVTDSGMLSGSKTLVQTVDEAIQGGVTIVQLREKTAETGDFITLARKVLKVTRKAGVPLLINDRIDVALAVGADGVHIGQDDMSLADVRRILGPNKIIGVTVQSLEEAEAAVRGGANYLGIGTCYATLTKQVKVEPQGPSGIRDIWEHVLKLPNPTHPIRAVTIGGINAYNAVHVLDSTRTLSGNIPLDGLAVVSAIMATEEPRLAAQKMRAQIRFALENSWLARPHSNLASTEDLQVVRRAVVDVFMQIKSGSHTPLVQHITNLVVINDCANACLAMGGSPIMVTEPEEQHDPAPVISSLVINIGTLDKQQVVGMRAAMREARLHNTPIVLDPVAVGASKYRAQVIAELLRDFGAHVIKGNASEIAALAGSEEVKSRGVDSLGSGFSDPVAVVTEYSRRQRCVVVMTGAVDYLSDGRSTFAIRNGHPLQAAITGSGCMVGTALATYIHSIAHVDPLIGAIAGMAAINLAAEHAASRNDVKGPGTFRATFIDEMYNLSSQQLQDEMVIERLL